MGAHPTPDSSRLTPRRDRSRVKHAATVLALVGLGLFAHRANITYGLVGYDTYPQILTSRIQSFGDLTGTFREPLADQFILAAFYRPVQNLSVALDYALWGLNPVGYQLTTLACFVACITLLYLTARKLLGRDAWLGPTVATLFVTLHPAWLNVLPTPCRRPELLVNAFLLAALLTLPVVSSKRSWRRYGLAGFFVLLAAGSKETGTIGVGLVFLHQLLFIRDGRFTRSLQRAALATLPAALAVTLYVVNRMAVLGVLGGYEAEMPASYVELLTRSAAQLAVDVLCPWSFLPRWTPAQLACLPLALLGLSLLSLLMTGVLTKNHGFQCAGRLIVIGVAWIGPVVLLLGVNPRYGPWYAVTPLTGLVLILAALVHGAGAIFRLGGLVRVLGAAPAAGVLAVIVVALWASPLWTDYPHWRAATRLQHEAQQQVHEKLRYARNGQSVRVQVVPRYGRSVQPDRPHTPSPPSPPLYAVRIWKAEGLHTWLRLRYPQTLVQVVYAGDPNPPPPRPRAVRLLVELDRSPLE